MEKFENAVLDIGSIPTAEGVVLEKINLRYYTVMLYNQLLFWLIFTLIIAVILFFIEQLRTTTVITLSVISLITIACLSFRLYYLSFINKKFAIREHDVIYQTGWFIKSVHVCPFSRIQHCSIDSGIFERKFGLAKLKIYTAGGDDSDITIPGLTLRQAEDLKHLIVQKSIPHDPS